MSSGWRKGPRCEVSNCPSQLWKVVDGREICKNGHVSSSIQLVDDDDDIRGHKRIKQAKQQINIPKLQEPTKLVGTEREKATTSICGALLREQARTLTRRFRLPREFEQVSRAFFVKLVKASALNPRNQSPIHGPPLYLEIPDSIIILRLALAHIGAPIYFMDLKRLADTGILPLNCPYAVPALGEILAKSKGVAASFYSTPTIAYFRSRALLMTKFLSPCPKLEFRPLVYKLVRDLMLPPVVYTFAINLLEPLDLTISDMDQSAIAAVVFATKALYQIASPDTSSRDNPDWQVWSDMMEKVWVNNRVDDWDEKDAMYWNEETVDTVLARYDYVFSHPEDNAKPNRLHEMFPIPSNPPPEEYDYKVHQELMKALYECSDSAPEETPVFGPPSNQYTVYNRELISDWILPPVIETLYRVCSQFLGVSEKEFRQYQYGMEHKFKRSIEQTSSVNEAGTAAGLESDPDQLAGVKFEIASSPGR